MAACPFAARCGGIRRSGARPAAAAPDAARRPAARRSRAKKPPKPKAAPRANPPPRAPAAAAGRGRRRPADACSASMATGAPIRPRPAARKSASRSPSRPPRRPSRRAGRAIPSYMFISIAAGGQGDQRGFDHHRLSVQAEYRGDRGGRLDHVRALHPAGRRLDQERGRRGPYGRRHAGRPERGGEGRVGERNAIDRHLHAQGPLAGPRPHRDQECK